MPCEHCDAAGRCTFICEAMPEMSTEAWNDLSATYPPSIEVKAVSEPVRKRVMEVGKEYTFEYQTHKKDQQKVYTLHAKVLWIGKISNSLLPHNEEVAVCLRETLNKSWCLDKFDPYTGQCYSLGRIALVPVEVKDVDWL